VRVTGSSFERFVSDGRTGTIIELAKVTVRLERCIATFRERFESVGAWQQCAVIGKVR